MITAKTQQVNPADKTIGAFVAEDYRVAQIFEKYGIDFCCGGNVPLAAASRERGIDPAAILQEIAAARSEPIARSENYAVWELPFLADYIVNTHHAYLNENTAQIAAYVRKIAAVHGTRHPEVVEIAAIFERIAADMAAHLREEEKVLFPALRRIVAARNAGTAPAAEDSETIRASLEKLSDEHETIGEAVHAIRHLAHGYAIPDGVCNTYVVTYRKLKEFEDDLHKHVHLENNILFPKAAQL